MDMYYNFHNYIKTKYREELSPVRMSAPLREARIFELICKEIPLKIFDGDLIGAHYGPFTAEGFEYEVESDLPYTDFFSADERRLKRELDASFGFTLFFATAHTCADYGRIAREGLLTYRASVSAELERTAPDEREKRDTLAAMLISLDAVKFYSDRVSSLAREEYERCTAPHLLRLADAASRVPTEPARDIFEALVSLWIMHTLIPLAEHSWSSVSLGRVDQFLYPFFKRSLENGESREEIKECFKSLYRFINDYGDGACALNIGGTDKDGNDMINELSMLLIEVEKEMLTASPIFALRVGDSTPDEVLDAVIDEKLFAIGQPTFYGEMPCRKALHERGVPDDDAVGFSVNSCMGLFMSGEEFASMWGCVFNMHLPLELALTGNGIFKSIPFTSRVEHKTPTNIEELFELYEKYMSELFDVCVMINRNNAENAASNNPDPLLSAMTEGCVSRGKDRAVGAKYNTETIETIALVNTANAIAAIDTLVFREKKYTLDEYIDAVKTQFENAPQILHDIKGCEKYGTASEYADSISRRLVHIASRICKAKDYDNVRFLPSLHTIGHNVVFGSHLYSTLDARPAGAPVAKNAGPADDQREKDHTGNIISAAALDQRLLTGGQPIDLYFDKKMLSDADSRAKIRALIRTYFQLGGLQFQVNSVDVNLLQKAYDEPEKHHHVIVRYGGYSGKFVDLNKSMQTEFIERFKKENN